MPDQSESANNGTQNSGENTGQKQVPSTKQQFRGAAIHIKEDGTLSVELVGITTMEFYGALDLVITRVKKQLGGDGSR